MSAKLPGRGNQADKLLKLPRTVVLLREVLQSLRSATADVIDVAAPRPGPGQLLIRSAASVVSAGTERMLIDFARAGLIGKARQQPERVREVAEKVRTDGLFTTLEAVRSRLEEPLALGYANAGYIEALGPQVTGFEVGQLVASNGAHAELVCVPTTLCAPVPEGVVAEQAAFATLGAIALQGIRLARPSLGERFVVTGLGLIGLLAVQLLTANGCEVLGIDVNPARLDLAKSLGATVAKADGDPLGAAAQLSKGTGVDGVIIAASASSSEPVHQAAQMCRRRGRIVLVGVVGLELLRTDFYDKELSFQVSCSYGPGRYDPLYEEQATDYPTGFVRWTAGRNMSAVLDQLAAGRLDVSGLVTHRFPLERAPDAYRTLAEDRSALAVVLQYPTPPVSPQVPLSVPTYPTAKSASRGSARVGLIGAGSFATGVMLPALNAAGADVVAIASRGGRSASLTAKRFTIPRSTNDPAEIITDPNIDAVVVCTRHDSHASLVATALDNGKHVFVEKPLAIDRIGLDAIIDAYERRLGSEGIVAIGFNRRFSPITQRMVDLLDDLAGPRAISVTVNAGAVPTGHWTQDPRVGGGRIVGEGCHFIDLARHLAASEITQVSAAFLGAAPSDSAMITLRHANGSVSTISYLANGSKRFPKERITVFCSGRVLENDNFRRLSTYGWHGRKGTHLLRQDKGHAAGINAFVESVRTGSPPPIPFDEIVEVSAAALLAAQRVT